VFNIRNNIIIKLCRIGYTRIYKRIFRRYTSLNRNVKKDCCETRYFFITYIPTVYVITIEYLLDIHILYKIASLSFETNMRPCSPTVSQMGNMNYTYIQMSLDEFLNRIHNFVKCINNIEKNLLGSVLFFKDNDLGIIFSHDLIFRNLV